MATVWRATWMGFLTWAVPLAVSFAFFDRSGALAIPQPLFKSLMVVISGGLGAAVLALFLRRVAPTVKSGLLVGLYWLVLNLGLDLATLFPMAHLPLGGYVEDIGLRYLLIPMMATAMGAVGSGARA